MEMGSIACRTMLLRALNQKNIIFIMIFHNISVSVPIFFMDDTLWKIEEDTNIL